MKELFKKIVEWLNPPIQEKSEVHEGRVLSKYRKANPPMGGTPPMLMMARQNYQNNPDSFDFFMVNVEGKHLHLKKVIWDRVEVGSPIKITYRFPDPGNSLMSQINSSLKTECTVEHRGEKLS